MKAVNKNGLGWATSRLVSTLFIFCLFLLLPFLTYLYDCGDGINVYNNIWVALETKREPKQYAPPTVLGQYIW